MYTRELHKYVTHEGTLEDANQLSELATRAHTLGSLDKIQEISAQGLEACRSLAHATFI